MLNKKIFSWGPFLGMLPWGMWDRTHAEGIQGWGSFSRPQQVSGGARWKALHSYPVLRAEAWSFKSHQPGVENMSLQEERIPLLWGFSSARVTLAKGLVTGMSLHVELSSWGKKISILLLLYVILSVITKLFAVLFIFIEVIVVYNTVWFTDSHLLKGMEQHTAYQSTHSLHHTSPLICFLLLTGSCL